jgi:hypothetical protein
MAGPESPSRWEQLSTQWKEQPPLLRPGALDLPRTSLEDVAGALKRAAGGLALQQAVRPSCRPRTTAAGPCQLMGCRPAAPPRHQWLRPEAAVERPAWRPSVQLPAQPAAAADDCTISCCPSALPCAKQVEASQTLLPAGGLSISMGSVFTGPDAAPRVRVVRGVGAGEDAAHAHAEACLRGARSNLPQLGARAEGQRPGSHQQQLTEQEQHQQLLQHLQLTPLPPAQGGCKCRHIGKLCAANSCPSAHRNRERTTTCMLQG